jgi:large subunit ribosomal protein L24
MKKKFSAKWNGSRQPRKQRKYIANAPNHIRRKLVSSNLSKELRKKYGKRNFPLRKGDKVSIMTGEFNKKSGNVDSIDLKRTRVIISGIHRTKKDGTKINVYFDPSNLQIKELNLDDKKRLEALNRKATEKKAKEIKINNKNTMEKQNAPKKK